ncbi:MAG: hypothetical protein ACOYMN_21170, partial [Roseimicrobium sp.]
MGPEMREVMQVLFTVAVEGLDVWNTYEPHKRGYYFGYVAFEVFIAVVGVGACKEEKETLPQVF